jgi:hypothetical protein
MSIQYDISIEDYHASPDHCSHSRFRDFVNHGARFYFETYVMRSLAKKATKAKSHGQLFETKWMEGDEAFDNLVFVQHIDGRKCKPQLDAAKAAGKIIIKIDEYLQFQVMHGSLTDNADAMTLMEPANAQATIRERAFGLPMQSRPDYLNLEGVAFTDYCPYTADLKTCDSLSGYSGRAQKVYAFGYHTQAALARACLRANGIHNSRHYLVLVEKTGACRSAVREIPSRVLDFADAYYAKYAPGLVHCFATNTWPRSEPTEEIDLPGWGEAAPQTPEMPAEETEENV